MKVDSSADFRPNRITATSQEDLLVASQLRVTFPQAGKPVSVVDGISFQIGRGECLAIVGESGSGKSVTARALIGLAGPKASVTASRLSFAGQDLLRCRERQWRELRGARIGFVLQDALVSLDPVKAVGREVSEAISAHGPKLRREQLEDRVIDLFRRVGIPDAANRARQLPHELSGGLRQRALIATAIAADPDLVIADEPTTALDVTIQAQILDLFESLKDDGKSLLIISHDLAIVSRLADRIAVMNHGRIVEAGTTGQVLFSPQNEYTKLLLAAVPDGKPKGVRLSAGRTAPNNSVPMEASSAIIARVRDATKTYLSPDGVSRAAVEDVSFSLFAGETLGIVGESGSGKTTVGRILLGLTQPDAGLVEVAGQSWSSMTARESLLVRRTIQVIHQDTLGSFDPRYTVGRTLTEALEVAGIHRGREGVRKATELLESVGLPPSFLQRRPIELSGGQRQRVAIARALAPGPKIIVCDEPVSALDVSVQAQVLDLLAELQERTGVSYLFISHDLSVINHISDRVLVMKDGHVIEQGTTVDIFNHPTQPYTIDLISAIPKMQMRQGSPRQ
jgi:peptide/nickel transport system ATP-binding protein